MSLNDMFRRFFGFPSQGYHEELPPEHSQPMYSDDPYSSTFSDDADDMFHHFEQHFQNVFRSFGFMEFSPSSFPFGWSEREMIPSLPTPNDVPLRDKLLKEPDSGVHNPRVDVPADQPHFHQPEIPGFRGPFGPSKPEDGIPPQDKDLDSAVSKEGLDLILRQPTERYSQQTEPRTTHSFFSSSSVTIRGADGKVEERYTKRDSLGNEETSVRRQYGDRIHSVLIRKDKEGKQEQEEHFTNMDETNKTDFENLWKSGNGHPSDGLLLNPSTSQGTSYGILQRLFKILF